MIMRWGPSCSATATMARVASAITGPTAPRVLMTASAPFMAGETAVRSVASPWTTWKLGLVRVSFSGDRTSAAGRRPLGAVLTRGVRFLLCLAGPV